MYWLPHRRDWPSRDESASPAAQQMRALDAASELRPRRGALASRASCTMSSAPLRRRDADRHSAASHSQHGRCRTRRYARASEQCLRGVRIRRDASIRKLCQELRRRFSISSVRARRQAWQDGQRSAAVHGIVCRLEQAAESLARAKLERDNLGSYRSCRRISRAMRRRPTTSVCSTAAGGRPRRAGGDDDGSGHRMRWRDGSLWLIGVRV
jgi:hypothetical protein